MDDRNIPEWSQVPVKKQYPHNFYIRKNLIDHGSYGEVYSARNCSTGEFVAMKKIICSKNLIRSENIQREIFTMFRIKHENCVKMFDCFNVNEIYWIVMEYCVGSIYNIIKARKNQLLNEVEISSILHHILKGLIFIHKNEFIHRDVKAANMLITQEGTIKIADFGSVSLKRTADTFMPSSYWTAPELLTTDYLSYTQNVDVWSLGITSIEIAEKKPPLHHVQAYAAIFQIPLNDPPTLANDKWSDSFKEFIHDCLIKDPSLRSTSEQIFSKHESFLTPSEPPKDVLARLVNETLIRVESSRSTQQHQLVTSGNEETGKELQTNDSGVNDSSSENDESVDHIDSDDLFKKFDELEECFEEFSVLEDSSDDTSSLSSDKFGLTETGETCSPSQSIDSLPTYETSSQPSDETSDSKKTKGIVKTLSSQKADIQALTVQATAHPAGLQPGMIGRLSKNSHTIRGRNNDPVIAMFNQMRQENKKQLKVQEAKLEKAMNDFKYRCWKQFDSHIISCDKEMSKLRSKHLSQIEEMAKNAMSDEKHFIRSLKDQYETKLKTLQDSLLADYVKQKKSISAATDQSLLRNEYESLKNTKESELSASHDKFAFYQRNTHRYNTLVSRQKLDEEMLDEELKLLEAQMEQSHSLMRKTHSIAQSLELSQLEEFNTLRKSLMEKQFEIELNNHKSIHKKQQSHCRCLIMKKLESTSEKTKLEKQLLSNLYEQKMKEFKKGVTEKIRLIKRTYPKPERESKLVDLKMEAASATRKMEEEFQQKYDQIIANETTIPSECSPMMISLLATQKEEIEKLLESQNYHKQALKNRSEQESNELSKVMALRKQAIEDKIEIENKIYKDISTSRRAHMKSYHNAELKNLEEISMNSSSQIEFQTDPRQLQLTSNDPPVSRTSSDIQNIKICQHRRTTSQI